jgi:hypothetical protein
MVTKIELDQPSFLAADKGYFLVLHLEGPDLGPDFEGFFLDKDNESLGRHKGKVGKVKFNKFPYKDGQTKTGIVVERDADIIKALTNLLKEMGKQEWLESKDGKFDTIEDLIEGINAEKPYAGVMINYCIAGRQYLKQNGYTANDCYLPKWTRFAVPYESLTAVPSKLAKFDPAQHIDLPTPVKAFDTEDDMTTQDMSAAADSIMEDTSSPSTGASEIGDFDI